MNYLNNLIVEPLSNYSNAVRWHESPYRCHDNNDQHIQYSSKAYLLCLKQPITITVAVITNIQADLTSKLRHVVLGLCVYQSIKFICDTM